MIQSHLCQSPYEIRQIGHFLDELSLKAPDQRNWSRARWEYAAHFVRVLHQMKGNDYWLPTIRIWEQQGKILGVAHQESPRNFFIQRDPNHPELTEIMLTWIHSLALSDSQILWLHARDTASAVWAAAHGYQQTDDEETIRIADLSKPIPVTLLPSGHTISTMADDWQAERKCATIAAAFGSSGLPLSLYRCLQEAPLYRKDLDLITLSTDGRVSATLTLWHNPVTRIGYLEPLATHPDFQGQGLGKALISHGLNRLKNLGGTKVLVGAYSSKANAFYQSCGFTHPEVSCPWVYKTGLASS